MLLLRNLIYWLILVASLIAMFPFILLAAVVPNGAHTVARQWVKILMWSLKNIVGLKYRLVGAENIPDKPSIICAKHQRSPCRKFSHRRFSWPSVNCLKSPSSAGG